MTGVVIPATYKMFDLQYYFDAGLTSGNYSNAYPYLSMGAGYSQGGDANHVYVYAESNHACMPTSLPRGQTEWKLKSVVYGGPKPTYCPGFKGDFLYTFIDTDEVIAGFPNKTLGSFKDTDENIPNIPFDLPKMKQLAPCDDYGNAYFKYSRARLDFHDTRISRTENNGYAGQTYPVFYGMGNN